MGYILLKDKTEISYFKSFEVINEFIQNKFNNQLIIDFFHCDFEISIANAIESFGPIYQ